MGSEQMNKSEDDRAIDIAYGLRVKRNNAITAFITGTALAALAIRLEARVSVAAILLGIFAGVIYANGFEYLLHRFFLHWGEGYLVKQHGLHHSSPPNAARYVLFSSSAGVVVLVFVLNAIPVFAMGHWAGGGFAAGMFAAFTGYYIAYEEIHWRIHVGGLPRWMRFARRHHMLHHNGDDGRYNVFLPIFDWVFHRRAHISKTSF